MPFGNGGHFSMNVEGLDTKAFLREISTRLNDAAAVAQAALVCAEREAEREAIGIVADLDSLLHDVSSLHNALLVTRRPRRHVPQD